MNGEYLDFFLKQPNATLLSVLSLFFLGMMRIAPIVAFAPFLGGKLPNTVKVGLSLAVTAIMLPTIALTSHQTMSLNTIFIGYALKEVLIGVILAILCTIPFYIANMSGTLIDFMRGSQSLMVHDPLVQTQASSIGLLYNYILIVIFFQINGHTLFLNGVLDSYQILPADQGLSASFFHANNPIWKMIMEIGTKTLAISIQLAAPSLIAVLMTEVFLGIANRLAPQVQIAFLGMPIKSLVGLAVLYAAWFYILQQLAKQSLEWMALINKMIYFFQPMRG